MLKKIVLIFCLVFTLYILIAEPRMINIKRLLIAAGSPNGEFVPTMNVFLPEDMLVNSYFTHNRIDDPELAKIYEEELPDNKEGALKLGALYLFLIARDPKNKVEYLDGIESIEHNAKREVTVYYSLTDDNDKYVFKTFEITDKEISDYYNQAIKNEILKIEIKYLPDSEKVKATTLLYEYCINPTPENNKKLKDYTKQTFTASAKKGYAIMELVKTLSEDIFNLIYE